MAKEKFLNTNFLIRFNCLKSIKRWCALVIKIGVSPSPSYGITNLINIGSFLFLEINLLLFKRS